MFNKFQHIKENHIDYPILEFSKLELQAIKHILIQYKQKELSTKVLRRKNFYISDLLRNSNYQIVFNNQLFKYIECIKENHQIYIQRIIAGKNIEAYIFDFLEKQWDPERNKWKPGSYYIYGQAGTGKTLLAQRLSIMALAKGEVACLIRIMESGLYVFSEKVLELVKEETVFFNEDTIKKILTLLYKYDSINEERKQIFFIDNQTDYPIQFEDLSKFSKIKCLFFSRQKIQCDPYETQISQGDNIETLESLPFYNECMPFNLEEVNLYIWKKLCHKHLELYKIIKK